MRLVVSDARAIQEVDVAAFEQRIFTRLFSRALAGASRTLTSAIARTPSEPAVSHGDDAGSRRPTGMTTANTGQANAGNIGSRHANSSGWVSWLHEI